MEDLIKALQILLKYGNPFHPSHCKHDLFHIDINPELVNEEDTIELDNLGFFVDDDGFSSFRFGSC